MRAAGVLFRGLACLPAQPKVSEPGRIDARWVALLIGDWVGEGGGGPGQGTGEFSFQLDLSGAILIRKNVSHYPATENKPAYSHKDLMIIDSTLHASYFDDEGHIIHYPVTPGRWKQRAICERRFNNAAALSGHVSQNRR